MSTRKRCPRCSERQQRRWRLLSAGSSETRKFPSVEVEADAAMKLLLEIVLAIFLHPVAMFLMWINLLSRRDLVQSKKIIWFIVSLIWGLGPILYILVAEGTLW